MTRRRDQRGFMSTEWVAAVGFLLVPVFVLVASASRIPEMQAAAQTMATESARAGAQANSCLDAEAAARRVVRSADGTTGLADDLGVSTDADDGLTFSGSDWRSGGSFRVTSKVRAKLVVPGIWEVDLPAQISLSAAHTEPIDKYRFLDETPCPS